MPSAEGHRYSNQETQSQSFFGKYKATDKILASWAKESLKKVGIVKQNFDIGSTFPENEIATSLMFESPQTRAYFSLDSTGRIISGFRIESKNWEYFLEAGLLDSDEIWMVGKNQSGEVSEEFIDLSEPEYQQTPNSRNILADVFEKLKLPTEDLDTLKELYNLPFSHNLQPAA